MGVLLNLDNITKDQHYVPIFYLKQFADDNDLVYCYSKVTKKRFNAHPKNICYKKYCYEVKLSQPINGFEYLLPNATEKMFASFEGEYHSALQSIVKKCELNSDGQSLICTAEEKRILASMTANFILRNPYVVDKYPNEAEIDEIIENNEEINSINKMLIELRLGDVRPFVNLVKKRIFFDPKQDGTANDIANDLMSMNLSFLLADNIEFITSDCPVGYNCDENNMKMARIPLSPKVMAVYSRLKNAKPFKNKSCKIGDKYVVQLNRDYLNWGYAKNIYSKNKGNIDLLLLNSSAVWEVK